MLSPDEWYAQGAEYDHRGHSIWMRDSGGGGKPLILIHGFPTASWDWHAVWDELAAEYRLLTLDLIGFGRSDKPADYPYSLFDQADLVEGVARHLGVDRACLLAHDYGDTVAQELLARQRDGDPALSIERCCLLNGGIIPGEHRPTRVQKLLASPIGWLVARMLDERRFNRAFSAIFGPETRPTPEQLAACWSLVTHHQGQRIAHRLIRYMKERERHRERWVGALAQAAVPLCLINGLCDPVSGGHVVDVFRRLVPAARVVELADIGHYPQLEAPGRVAAEILDFLAADPH